ncbi:MAG TPA: histidine triad nucleotide-binding protein [Desulfomonilaceae bacterium]|nr:histidine triad nucleotide-binding protein [Desulfomonilaceae bacterium]
MDDCIFCRIIDGRVPAEMVYQDDSIVAFRDARPASPIHVLIVPRKHIPTLNDIAEDDRILSEIGTVAKKIAGQLGVGESGYRFFINVNRGGGQVVFHLHAHVVAGNDLGTFFIKAAVCCAIIWRKLASLFGR